MVFFLCLEIKNRIMKLLILLLGFTPMVHYGQYVNGIHLTSLPGAYIQVEFKGPYAFSKSYAEVNYGQVDEQASKIFSKKHQFILKNENDEIIYFQNDMQLANYIASFNYEWMESYQPMTLNDDKVEFENRKIVFKNMNIKK